MSRLYVMCQKCRVRNERLGGRRKCINCGSALPKRRVAKHAKTLRDDSYAVYVQVARDVHGVTDESCCVCGRPRHESMKHHRDHDHVTGQPRGIVCFQCNQLMPRLLTVERARLILAYLERVEAA
jgi:ribosomal protein S26